MTTLHVDDMGPPEAKAFKFKRIGDTIKGTVTYTDKFVRTSEYTDLEERVARIVLLTDDLEAWSLYPILDTNVNGKGWANRMTKAIGAAVRAKGAEVLEVGGTLAVKYSEDIETDRGHPAKGFVAQYEPPAPEPKKDEGDADDGAVNDLF